MKRACMRKLPASGGCSILQLQGPGGFREARGILTLIPNGKRADATTGPETRKSPKIANQQGKREVFLYRVI